MFHSDIMKEASEIASHERLTHPHTLLILALFKLPPAVKPAPPLLIYSCHSFRKLSLKGLFIDTSNG